MSFDKYTITQINDHDKELLQAYKFVFVPNKSHLNDTRSLAEFKTLTLGGFQKGKVFSAMEKAITSAKIEHACYWAYQLLASGQATALWDRLFLYIYKNINIANSNLPGWILGKDIAWIRLISIKEYTKDGILHLRNNQLARNLITEMVTMICLSRKRKLDSLTLKIKETDFIIANFHAKCQVRDNIMIAGLLGPNDPSEIRIACNEFCYNLVNKQIQETLYWLNWILYWEKINVKKYKLFIVQQRNIEGIQTADQRDVIWLVWSIIQQVKSKVGQAMSANGGNKLAFESALDMLWKLYLHKWKPSNKTKKLYIIYWVIHILIYPCDWNIGIIERPEIFIKACANTNLMFEKLAVQCKTGFGAVTYSGPTLLDMKEEQSVQNSSITPLSQKYGAKLMGDIGSNSGLNVIIEDNYKIPAGHNLPAGDIDATEGRSGRGVDRLGKKAGGGESVLSASMNKLSIVNQLDAYLTT
jgi:hypothetical protein